jgi:DNA/RNA endonuclease G (NUC1)/uncharacterized protein YjdB
MPSALRRHRLPATLCIALLASACGGVAGVPPTAVPPGSPQFSRVAIAALPSVRFSELHYDNAGTDADERIEISGPAGTDLTGWTVLLYNGNGGAVYNTRTLSGAIPATCGARGVVVLTYPVDGIQNGSPDGLALVDGAGQLVEFLSYEGSFTGSGGAANGVVSTDIGVAEGASTLTSQSLQRTVAGDNSWLAPAAHSFGACNDAGAGPSIGPLESVTISGPTTVAAGADITLTAVAEDAEGDDITAGTIAWSDGGSASVTVTPSADGRSATVHGDAAGGPVTITATLTLDGRTRADDHPVAVTGGGTPSATNVRVSEIHYDNDGTDAGEAIEVEGDAGGSLAGWSLVLYTGSTGATYATIPLTGTLPSSCSTRGVLQFAATGIQNGGLSASEPDGVALVDNTGAVVEFVSYEGAFTATTGPASGRLSTDIGVDEDPAPAAGQSLQRALNGVWFGPAAATFGACNPATPPGPPPVSIVIIGRNAPTAGGNADPPLPIGYQDQLFAQSPPGTTLTPAQVTWSVDPSTPFATVDAEGVVTGIAQGTAIVRATRVSDGATATFAVPVMNPPDGPATYGNHLEFGRPLALASQSEILVTWPEFVSSYNPLRGQPNWVAYNLDADDRGPADRCECFTHDPSLPGGVTVINTDDYTNSGYSRGHMVMSEDRTSGGRSTTPTQTSVDNARTFLFSNVIPQTSANNSGPWLALESYLGGLATTGGKEIFIYAGGAAYSGTLKNEGKVAIPTRTWKVAVILPGGQGLANVDDPGDLEVIAVDMPNASSGLSGDWRTYRVTVDQVEALVGYDLLSALPDAVECRVEQAVTPAASCTPEARLWTASGVATVKAGTPLVFNTAALDDATDAPWRYVLTWGDGTSFSATLAALPAVQRPLARSKTWTAPGTYTVTLSVTDRTGKTGTQSLQVVVRP